MDRPENNTTPHGSSGNSLAPWPRHSSVRVDSAPSTTRHRSNQDFSLHELHRIATQRGGECLSRRYLKTMAPLRSVISGKPALLRSSGETPSNGGPCPYPIP